MLTIPNDLFPFGDWPEFQARTAIRSYESGLPNAKTRVTLRTNLVSFLLEGEKTVHRPGEPMRIKGGQFLLIAGGNTLMSEKLSINGRYRSLLFFFDDSVFKDFFLKYPGLNPAGKGNDPIVSFSIDEFIRNFLHSLQLMPAANPDMQKNWQLLKFEELMLYLAGKAPESLAAFRLTDVHDADDRQLMAVVEGNVNHAITVDELSFLCNMSLSTFKRRFARLYATSPNKWLLQKRMELAASLLDSQEKPSEVYHKVGYENHSSFTQSFKQVYGVTPREFQKRTALTVYP
ncbi:helix-turn-helix domain-containing protein [Puia dinghuensis]|nr:AraC family transcriptional regulator [Puia dinghuensis]